MQELQHPHHLRAGSPPGGFLVEPRGVVLELAGGQGAVSLELAQDVAPEPGLLLHELFLPSLPLGVAPGRAHQGPNQRQVVDRVDEGVPLEELSLLPEQPVEVGAIVGSEPAPEDEVLGRRDGRDRVDLEAAEVANRRQDVPRRAVEELGAHGHPPCLGRCDLAHRRCARYSSRSVRVRTPIGFPPSATTTAFARPPLRVEKTSSSFSSASIAARGGCIAAPTFSCSASGFLNTRSSRSRSWSEPITSASESSSPSPSRTTGSCEIE